MKVLAITSLNLFLKVDNIYMSAFGTVNSDKGGSYRRSTKRRKSNKRRKSSKRRKGPKRRK